MYDFSDMPNSFFIVVAGRVKLEEAGQHKDSKVLVEGEWFGYDVYVKEAVAARERLKGEPFVNP